MTTHTKIDDILIEMISPKLKEIEERFSRGEGLNNDDINTLLLKSQFNHINHLDQKLDEVTADVASLKLDFAKLNADVKVELSKFDLKLESMNTEIQKTINKNMQWSIGIIAFIVTMLKFIDVIWGK
jgi:tetrahydromethanopterin S-methyltransferase subunit G